MRQLLQPQLLVVRCRVAPPAHQEARDAAHHPAVEQQLHLVLALLPQVGYWPGSRWHPGPREQSLVDRPAAAHLAPQGEGVGVGARAGRHCEGAVPPREQLANVGGV